MYKTRTRMVSFRLSEDEYERLKDLSMTECARSISEFARDALCKLSNSNPAPQAAAPRVEKLETTVHQLKLDLHDLRNLVEAMLSRTAEPAAASALPGARQ